MKNNKKRNKSIIIVNKSSLRIFGKFIYANNKKF